MRTITSILILFVCTFGINAQKVDYFDTSNDILRVGQKLSSNYMGLMGNIWLSHYIELYTDGESKEYVLKINIETGVVEPHLFPANAKMLLKISNKDILELTSAIHTHSGYGAPVHPLMGSAVQESCHSTACFPLTEEQLEKISKKGMVKTRLEILTYDEKDGAKIIHHDYSMKVDKVKSFVKQSDKNIEVLLGRIDPGQLKRDDIKDGF